MLLNCDIVIAEENAKFALLEAKRGVVVAGGGTSFPPLWLSFLISSLWQASQGYSASQVISLPQRCSCLGEMLPLLRLAIVSGCEYMCLGIAYPPFLTMRSVNEIVPCGKAIETATSWALKICKHSPDSTQAIKEILTDDKKSWVSEDIEVGCIHVIMYHTGANPHPQGEKPRKNLQLGFFLNEQSSTPSLMSSSTFLVDVDVDHHEAQVDLGTLFTAIRESAYNANPLTYAVYTLTGQLNLARLRYKGPWIISLVEEGYDPVELEATAKVILMLEWVETIPKGTCDVDGYVPVYQLPPGHDMESDL